MNKKITIGFLVSGIMDSFTEYMCNGITLASSADDDVNIVVVPVKYIDRDPSGLQDKYEYQYKVNAQHLTAENVDALIVAADCIGCLTTKDNLMKFMSSLPDVPTILIATRIDGYPGVSFDNKYGIREGLEYLINELGVKNVCMMGGSETFFDAVERREVYEEVMKKYGLEYGEKRYIETNMTEVCQKEARKLLDDNPHAEAIFCANDAVALGLYEVMKERGLEPGRDIKVLGFDNAISGAMISPSLSTVDADAMELGKAAYKMTRRLLSGEKVGEEQVPTRFIIRDSFGTSDVNIHPGDNKIMNKDLLDQYFNKVFYRYRGYEQRDDSRLRMSFISMMECMIDFAKMKEGSPESVREVLKHVDEFMKLGALDYTDNDELIPYFEEVHAAIVKNYEDPERKSIAYQALSLIFKRIIKTMSYNNVQYEAKLDDMLYSMKTLVKDTLSFTYGNDGSYVSIVSGLRYMGFKNAYVYIYEKPIVHLEYDEFEMPKYVRLKAALRDGKVRNVHYNMQRISLNHLFDNYFVTTKKYNMALMPLYFGDTLYGCILYDLDENVFKNGEFLSNQFSTAARMIEILRQNNEIQKQLEENLAVMAEHNIELDKLSRNDVLTGILNRRGFFDVAEGIARDGREEGRETLISYVDMNNLKIINDRFGHDDGDFALKTVSIILTEVIGKKGIVGRIGGDEYAFVYYGNKDEAELEKDIVKGFDEFNKSSDKPYNVSVSCGYFRITPDSDISLEDAIAIADMHLYEAKKHKDNRILKET